jgi:L-aminopeptidase/D-esterase-like protein
MHCYDFKGGTGTASRKVSARAGGYTVGVLVQANFGRREHLMIAGAPVGREIGCDKVPCLSVARPADGREGSIIIVVATDAPLLAHQLKRLARRTALGIGRTGSMSGNGSGDIFMAFSTANSGADSASDAATLTMLPNRRLDELFEATVFATEEAVINAMVAAETMVGRDYHKTIALPHDELRRVLRKYSRLADGK